MDAPASPPAVGLDRRAQFATTHWSVVLQAGEGSSPETAAALETLCRAYWYPLYAFARRSGHSPEDAQDQSLSKALHSERAADSPMIDSTNTS